MRAKCKNCPWLLRKFSTLFIDIGPRPFCASTYPHTHLLSPRTALSHNVWPMVGRTSFAEWTSRRVTASIKLGATFFFPWGDPPKQSSRGFRKFLVCLCCRCTDSVVAVLEMLNTRWEFLRFGFHHTRTRTDLCNTSHTKPKRSGLGNIVCGRTRNDFMRTSVAKSHYRVRVSVRRLYYYNGTIRKPERHHCGRSPASATLYRAPSS